MSAFTPASEVLLRHSDDFEPARVLFAGDLQDDLPARLDTAASRAHTQQFHHWQALNGQMGENVRFSLVAEASDVADCDTLIYYWPKNKPEAQFQLMNLLSLLPVGIDVFRRRGKPQRRSQRRTDAGRICPSDESGQRTSLRAVSRASGKTADVRSAAVLGRIPAGKSDH